MSRVTELEKALTTLFRKGTEVGYTETEIDEFLVSVDAMIAPVTCFDPSTAAFRME